MELIKLEKYAQPYIVNFPVIGNKDEGYISVADYENNMPFSVRRSFWTYNIPNNTVRGNHAHYSSEQLLVAVSGSVTVKTGTPEGEQSTFVLDTPCQGLYIPPHVWRELLYGKNAVQMVMSSTKYDESDYIRDYDEFTAYWGT